ncbi:MAG: PEP-CTERM system TPR-repeat protein PrsT [Gammaproteobacteria bacterium]|nr:PEP-CTERM system TPR-repeat protein PrsT [Gammaproteobacteria bacterium]MCP5202045.1 PEP-CTERM system TPR-repeat protein PrsT [Gammaproteobacteria bacterium]
MSASRKRRRKGRGIRIAIIVLGLAVAGGAAFWVTNKGGVDTGASLARARTAYDAGDLKAAVIDLKTVLSSEPDNRAARFLLGRIYVDGGNPQGAIKELRRARDLGETAPELNLGLTRAMLLAGKFDEAATEIAIYGDTARPEWAVLRGMLDLAQQRLDDARATFKTVLANAPDNLEARRGLMQAELAAGDAAMARNELEKLMESEADDPGLWIIKGDLELHDGRQDEALAAFTKAVELAPKNPLARMGMARALIAGERFDEAANQLDAIGANGADDPRVQFLRAQIADGRGDANSALVALRKVLQVAPMHRDSLIMAAKLHFGQGEFTAAQDYISRLLEIEPQNAAARRMLGAIQLAAGRLDGLDELSNAAGDGAAAQDPGMLALLGTTYLKYGKFGDSQASLERAAELAPDSLPIRTQLALSRLSAGKPEQAIEELQAIRTEDPSFVQADIMLALVYMSQKDNDKALEVAQALVEKNPESALAENVLGYVRETAGDNGGAAQAYDKALQLDPKFHPARINLARLAIRAGDTATGRARFQEVLDSEPFHAFALMGMAALALQDNDLDEAERLWQVAREHNPDAVAPRLLLAKHYRTRGNQPLAETMIKEAYRLAPYALQVQAEYAEIMLQGGHFEEALEAAKALVERVPDSLPGLELLARVYNQLGDADNLTATLERAAEVAPEAVGTQVLLGRLAIRRKDFDQARAVADSLSKSGDGAAAGLELRGDVYLAQDELEDARKAYLAAHEKTPTTANLLKLDQVERRLDRPTDRLDRWLAEHPDDLQARFARASYLQQQGTGKQAIPEYEKMIAERGANPILLNNLAWLYHEAGDARAADVAKQAYDLAPKQPEIMDTYGWILFNTGKQEQGLDMLEKAHDAAPANPDIAFHVLHARFASGAHGGVAEALEKLLADNPEFALRKDAEALLVTTRAE